MMTDINFNIQPVEEKPQRVKMETRKKRKKYEPIIDAFLDSEHSIVRVEGTRVNPYYLRGQLNKTLELREISSVDVSVRNQEVYLEKR